MLRNLRRAARSAFLAIGYDVHRVVVPEPSRLFLVCRDLGIDVVLDVGANVGQFAQGLRSEGYAGRIVSFEPASNARTKLVQAANDDPAWVVAPRLALGPEDGEIDFNVAGNEAASSSVLPMLDRHLQVAPHSAYSSVERVPLRRLDRVAREFLPRGDERVLLKIDVQGYEDQVLAGATELLPAIAAVYLEMSLVPLYSHQTLFIELYERIRALGYHLYDVRTGFTDHRKFELLQVNALFVRDGVTGA